MVVLKLILGGDIIKNFNITIGLAALLMFSPINQALSQPTPDGETPAVEDTCDHLQGGTPGLFGLCIAACEARDLGDPAVMTEREQVHFERLLAKYETKRAPGDPDLPCATVHPVPVGECPLLTQETLDEIILSIPPDASVTQRYMGKRVEVPLDVTWFSDDGALTRNKILIDHWTDRYIEIRAGGPDIEDYRNTLYVSSPDVTPAMLDSCNALAQQIYDYLTP
ncbi:MAG: hypothetical protein D3917_09690 [Candidatus Electrothrix sp. AX5]|nr:hypothetical protein [Candidatus Electrothrix sp. AX5]